MTKEDVIFEVYETKIKRQQEELRRMNEEREHLLKIIHKKNLQGMRLVRRRKELQEQIEKMKCCGNCTHRRYWGNELDCKLDLDKQFECDNNNKKYWEFREG